MLFVCFDSALSSYSNSVCAGRVCGEVQTYRARPVWDSLCPALPFDPYTRQNVCLLSFILCCS